MNGQLRRNYLFLDREIEMKNFSPQSLIPYPQSLEMPGNTFIEIRSYDEYVSAHIAMGRLEEDGIRVWLKDEHTLSINPAMTHALGGIKLMVLRDQAERANEILRTIDIEAKKSNPCPKCGSQNVELINSVRHKKGWLAAIIAILVSAPTVGKAYHCFECGNEFR